MRHNFHDGGPYLTPVLVARPAGGERHNTSWNRMMYIDSHHLAIYMSPRHLWMYFQEAEAAGRSLPVAVILDIMWALCSLPLRWCPWIRTNTRWPGGSWANRSAWSPPRSTDRPSRPGRCRGGHRGRDASAEAIHRRTFRGVHGLHRAAEALLAVSRAGHHARSSPPYTAPSPPTWITSTPIFPSKRASSKG